MNSVCTAYFLEWDFFWRRWDPLFPHSKVHARLNAAVSRQARPLRWILLYFSYAAGKAVPSWWKNSENARGRAWSEGNKWEVNSKKQKKNRAESISESSISSPRKESFFSSPGTIRKLWQVGYWVPSMSTSCVIAGTRDASPVRPRRPRFDHAFMGALAKLRVSTASSETSCSMVRFSIP